MVHVCVCVYGGSTQISQNSILLIRLKSLSDFEKCHRMCLHSQIRLDYYYMDRH